MNFRSLAFFNREKYGLNFHAIILINALKILLNPELVVSEKRVTEEICTTTACYEAATVISANLDKKIDPCDNFYKFACGGFIKKNAIPDNKNSISRMDEVEKKVKSDILEMLEEEPQQGELEIFQAVKNYFRACMDTVQIDDMGKKTMLDIIEKLGGWPVIEGDSWNEDNFDLQDTMIKLRKLGYQHKYLVNIYVFNDLFNTSSYQLYIDKAEPYLSYNDYQEPLDSYTLRAYRLLMEKVAIELGANKSRAAEEVYAIAEFEKYLVMLADVEPKEQYEIHYVYDLERRLPWFPWLQYLNNLAGPYINFTKTSKVFSDEPYYLELLQAFLEDVDKRTLANYLIWRAVADSLPYLYKKIISLKDQIYYETKPERWEQCIKWLNDEENGLPVGVSALYVRKHFKSKTKREVKKLVNSIANQFQERIQKVSWIDDETKARAFVKSQIMKQIVGHPEEMLVDRVLNNYTLNLVKIDPKQHLINILNIRRFQFDNSLTTYNEYKDYDWSEISSVTKTNALYYHFSNSFAILAGILRRPLFDPGWPSYAKYGSMGFIIGHEMMHAYDWSNFKFDENGNLKQWYSNKSAVEYRKRLDCFEKQYAQFKDENVDLNVDGGLTLNENIADNVGLKVAYKAYKSDRNVNDKQLKLPGLNYTADQLFWMYSVNFLCSQQTFMYRADVLANEVHAPADFRVLGEMINSQNFAKDFNCPLNSPMNPRKKCELM